MPVMPTPLQMSVPVDARFRAIGAEVAGKYAELIGCSADDARAVGAAVDAAIAELARDAAADANAELSLAGDQSEVAITVRCHGRSSVVRRSLPAGHR